MPPVPSLPPAPPDPAAPVAPEEPTAISPAIALVPPPLTASASSRTYCADCVGNCTRCGTGQMRIIKMKTGAQFIGCGNYPACTNTYSLPQGVKITGAGGKCEFCGAPMIRGFSGGRKIFEICPNPSCKQGTGQPNVPVQEKPRQAAPLIVPSAKLSAAVVHAPPAIRAAKGEAAPASIPAAPAAKTAPAAVVVKPIQAAKSAVKKAAAKTRKKSANPKK